MTPRLMLITICRWIVGTFFCLLALGGFANHDYIVATVVLICGLFALPLRKGKKSKNSQQLPVQSSTNKRMEDKKQVQFFTIEASKSTGDNSKPVDDSIIDVTGAEQKINFEELPIKVEFKVQTTYSYPDYTYQQTRLGDKYKQKLGLNAQEVSWLNKFWDPTNVFLGIEGCCIATIRLYLLTIKGINKELAKAGSSFAKEVDFFKDELKKSYTAVGWGYYDQSYAAERAQTDVYYTVFKRAEKSVRLAFGHKRQVTGDFPYPDQRLKAEFEARIGSAADRLIEQFSKELQVPDEDTEIQLNAQNVTRWKVTYEQLTKSFSEESKIQFIEEIHRLAERNRKNPSVENIFFEASKFMAKYDKEQSLKFYVHYLYHDLKSDKFDDRQLTKTIQKSLFKTNEQLHDFQKVVSYFIKTKDLDKALAEVEKIYQPKRKKIQLDKSLISEVQQQDRVAVELLNEYLQDNFEDDTTSIKTKEINSEEVSIEITSKHMTDGSNTFATGITLNQTQAGALSFFAGRSFSVKQSEIEDYCRENGVFKNQLIDSINEACYETIDDVLIEEDGDSYTIHESYYQKITAIC